MKLKTLSSRSIRVQVKNNFVREAVYRTNFLTMVSVDLIWIGVEFSLFAVIYANTPTLAGWTRESLLLPRDLLRLGRALYDLLPTQLLELLRPRQQGRTRYPAHQAHPSPLPRTHPLDQHHRRLQLHHGNRNHLSLRTKSGVSGRLALAPTRVLASDRTDLRYFNSLCHVRLCFLDRTKLGIHSAVLSIFCPRHQTRRPVPAGVPRYEAAPSASGSRMATIRLNHSGSRGSAERTPARRRPSDTAVAGSLVTRRLLACAAPRTRRWLIVAYGPR